jgi:DNA-binding CsgD family transcriptional regulator
MKRSDALDIVEGAYDAAIDGHQWLANATDRFSSRFQGALTPGSYVISKTAEGPPTFHNAYLGGVEDAIAVFEPMHATMDPALAEAVFPLGTHCSFFSEMWAKTPEGIGDPSPVLDHLRSQGGDDLLFACSFDHMGTGVLLGTIVERAKVRLTEASRQIHRRAAVHMATGLRLRRALESASSVMDAPEAVFEADGRLCHADGPATARDMRSQLQAAVERIDRARTGKVRKDELEALDLWQGLVEGRWSLIDRYDSDGRRYYVAIANPPEGVGARQLTETEAKVVAQAAAGEPNGVIAYSLGVAEATVASQLHSAMRKLGASSRMDLVRIGRALGVHA